MTYIADRSRVSGHGEALTDCGGLLPIIEARESENCLIDDAAKEWLDRRAVRARAEEWAAALRAPHKSLVMIMASIDITTVVAVLSTASAGHAAMLVDPTLKTDVLQRLFDLYRPDFVIEARARKMWRPDKNYTIRCANDQVTIWGRADGAALDDRLYPDLQLLLSTSGTTGSVKFVRLSREAVTANARQIAQALRIGATDVAIGHLPTHYSYGLSVITSHLGVGAAVAMINGGVTDASLWQRVAEIGGTHFPGVPFHYGVLARFGIETTVPRSVMCFTQAGGALEPNLQRSVHRQVHARGGGFYVMYGQTEAAPRMTTLDNEDFERKTGSVGKPLDGSRIIIVDSENTELPGDTSGTVIYIGPNVMLGYAEGRSDLATPDQMHQRLDTGDLGRLDADGFLFLEGRTKRFAKLYGLRLGLDELEMRLSEFCDVAAFDLDKKILLVHGPVAGHSLDAVLGGLAMEYKIPRSSFLAHAVSELPRLPSGKIDYVGARRHYEF